MIKAIASFESRSLLRAAQTWVIAAVLTLVFAYLFLQALEAYLVVQPQLALQDHPTGLSGFLALRYMAPLVMVFALIAPLLAMKSFSDEYRQQTMALWQSSPVSMSELVIGKFIGVCFVIKLLVIAACLIPLCMRIFTPIDIGVLASSALGLMFASVAFTAIGMFFSSITRHAIIAVAASVICLLLLWLLGSVPNSEGGVMSSLSVFAIPTHLTGFFQGFISSADIVYFMVLTIVFIALTIIRLDSLRFSGR